MKNYFIQGVALIVAFCLSGMASAKTGKDNLQFTRNIGQVTDQHLNPRNDIDFKVKGGNGLNIFIGNGKLHYQFSHIIADDSTTEMYRLDVELIGSNPNAKVIAEEKHQTFDRYYTNGLEGALAYKYSRITYRDVYPNIDWAFYFNSNGQLEHDFIVHEGGKVSDIKVRYSGATELILNEDGSLTATTPFGVVRENAPYAFQKHDKKEITSAFVLDGNILSFSTAQYSGTLVIDPVLEWGTYFGDTEVDYAHAVTAGKYGEVYMTGTTSSTANIATTGAHQTTFGGGTFSLGADAYLSRFDNDGNLVWATYYGGTGIDISKAITCDTTGNIYIAGYSNSLNDIATTGSHQDTKAGTASQYDAFLVKFDTSGSRFWGTYYGGSGQEGPGNSFIGLHCDNMDNIYLTGNTTSTSGIATTGAFQDTKSGAASGQDAFLARFDTAGAVQWATYIGGTAADYGCAVTTDASGNVYITGYSNSITQIGTTGTHQDAIGGNYDAFLMKFDNLGQRLWGTYFGGINVDRGYGLACDDSSNIYMVGITLSTSGIATSGGNQANHGGGADDGFIAKFNDTGEIVWASYIGGTSTDITVDVFHAISGRVYVAGFTSSTTDIATSQAVNGTLNGFSDAFVMSFETDGTLVWGSYFGGSDSEEAQAITGDLLGNIYIAGATNSPTQLATNNVHQTIFGGNIDAMLLRINDCDAPETPLTIIGDTEICGNDTMLYEIAPVAGVDGYTWILPNGWVGNSDSTSILATPDNNQGGNIYVASVNYCTTSDSISLAITVKPTPEPQIQRSANILSTTQPYASYQWNRDGLPIQGATNPTHILGGNGNYTVTVTAANDCEGTSDIFTVDNVSNHIIEGIPFNIYPNPATDKITVIVRNDCTVSIQDITGRIWITKTLKMGENIVGIGDLANGIYLLKVYAGDGSHIGAAKLIKATE